MIVNISCLSVERHWGRTSRAYYSPDPRRRVCGTSALTTQPSYWIRYGQVVRMLLSHTLQRGFVTVANPRCLSPMIIQRRIPISHDVFMSWRRPRRRILTVTVCGVEVGVVVQGPVVIVILIEVTATEP